MRPLFAILLIASSATAVEDPIKLRISRTYTNVAFTIYKWSVLKQEGHFSNCTGEIVLDREDPTRSRVRITVPLATIDTRNPHRDSALRGEDFFDAQRYPLMTFASTSVVRGPPSDTFEVTGDLTIRGVTRRMKVPVKFLGLGSRPGSGTFAGFEADFALDRTEFGVNGARWSGGKLLLSKEVQVHLTVGACVPGDHCVP